MSFHSGPATLGATLCATLACAALVPRAAQAQQFSAVMVDSHGTDAARTRFNVGDDKVRWVTTRGDSVTGAVILDFRRRTLTALDDQTEQYYTPSDNDPATELADLFFIMRPADLRDPCKSWNAAAPADKWQLTYKRSGKTGYAWIDPHLHYLVKMQDPAAQTTMQVREVKEGPQEPSLFVVPHGYTKMDPPEPPRPSHP